VTEHQLFLYLAEVVVLVAVARLGGEIALRLGIPQVIGELALGLCLGPSLFGVLWPGGFNALFPADPSQRNLLDITYWLGVVFLVLIAGVGTKLRLVRTSQRAAVASWACGFLLPFALGFALGWFTPADLIGPGISRGVFSLFFGTALSISAIPVIARILMDLNMLNTKVGAIIMSSAVADDTVGWIVLAVVTGLASAEHQVDKGAVATALIGTAALLVFTFTIGQRLVDATIRRSLRLKSPHMQATVMFLIVFAAGAFTQWIHVHLVLGVFIGGLLISRSKERKAMRASRDAVREIGFAFFIPFFFAYTGLKTDFTTLTGHALPIAILAVVLACLGKLIGASLGARIGGLSTWESLGVGSGRNARGAMELVIAGIGLSIGILTEPSYATVVLIAIVTTLMAGPMLRFCAKRSDLASSSGQESVLEVEAI
jgi:Kef-type K+ transport system membrane component KefB